MKWLRVVQAGSLIATALAAHAVVNARTLRRPSTSGPAVTERVSILVPARDEANHVATTVGSLLSQSGLTDFELLVLDDGSTDGTAAILRALAQVSPRLQVIHGGDSPPPPGWLGKPWACHRLSERATGSVLVFADADVMFSTSAVHAAVADLRDSGLAMTSPWPTQLADTWAERLIQPLQVWSWLSTMPVGLAARSTRPSLAAANGQFLVLDAHAYRAAGGHESVAGEVLDDINLMRAMKRAGLRTATRAGSGLASSRMYQGFAQVQDGYAKSLWCAFGGPVGSAGVAGLLLLAYVVPPTALVLGPSTRVRAVGAIGYLAGVAGRLVSARAGGDRVLPDAAAHPASITMLVGLSALSWARHLKGSNTWKGRPV